MHDARITTKSSIEPWVGPRWLKTLDTVHCLSFVPKRPRETAHKLVAKLPIAAIEVSTHAAPIIAGACSPVAPPAYSPIMVVALWADPVTLVLPPWLGERAKLPTSRHTTLQLMHCVHSVALPAAP